MRIEGRKNKRGRTAGIMLLTVATAAMIFLGGCASSRGRITAEVPLTITTSEAGDVYIDGERVATLEAGEEHRQTVLMGTYRIEMQFADGGQQRERVSVGSAVTVTLGREPESAVYQIGDRGPAGGIVFYDKGDDSAGWQYLEAAPNDIDDGRRISWSAAIGAASRFRFRGYSDWRLPTKDELNWMHENLHKRGVGGFASGIYWSSAEGDSYGAWAQNFVDGLQYSFTSTRQASFGFGLCGLLTIEQFNYFPSSGGAGGGAPS